MEERTQLIAELKDYLEDSLHTSFEEATPEQIYKALARLVNGRLRERYVEFKKTKNRIEKESGGRKKIYYISMEFLVGQSLKNALYCMDEMEAFEEILSARGMSPDEIFDCEPDAGLGNGGLGRLAACYLSAMATGGYDATGFSLRYEYGLFKQKIEDGWQVELPDNWIPGGGVWLNKKDDDPFTVDFYGKYDEWWGEEGMNFSLEEPQTIKAIPYDMYVPGAENEATCKLRLWRAIDPEGFDMETFNSGDFTRAALRNNRAEAITKVLYPPDNIEEGKELRLKQQYFMVSASCQNIVRDHLELFGSLDDFHLRNVIHINDTHPALCIPELMRIMMDEHGCSWDYAWEKVVGAVSYTNHTVLAEALERWKTSLVQAMMPRVFSIISEIDRRFREDMYAKFPGDHGKVNYTAVLGDGQVRMANLSVIGSHKVNGVSALHSQILKDDLFHDFFLSEPDKFTNVTNGIAYRRWLCQTNPGLAQLIDECIGTEYRHDDRRLEDFFRFREDKSVCERLEKIKRENKARFADRMKKTAGVVMDPDSIFIVQAKRLHEYKRQLLNVLRIISRYQMLKDDPNMDMRPETYLFAAKAAPSYFLAKHVIQLICKLAEEIEKDPKISSKLRVVFLENYGVSMAEGLMPATEISEQISLAGKEASGTGNMKMMINGAVTIGTLDGANVEIMEAVGPESIFIFGMKEDEVTRALAEGYHARGVYENNEVVRRAVDALGEGFAGKSFEGLKNYLLEPSYSIADPYMCLLDFDDYLRAHEDIQAAYEDRDRWNTMSIENIAKAARFAADRSIRDYAEKIWNTKAI